MEATRYDRIEKEYQVLSKETNLPVDITNTALVVRWLAAGGAVEDAEDIPAVLSTPLEGKYKVVFDHQNVTADIGQYTLEHVWEWNTTDHHKKTVLVDTMVVSDSLKEDPAP